MKLSSLFTLSVLGSLTLAYPSYEANTFGVSAAPHARALHARGKCPSVAEFQKWFRDNTKIGEKTIFYTKPATNADASFFANQIGGHYWGNLVKQDVYLDWVGACDGREQDLVTPRVAEAIALEAKGTAYVLMTGTPDPSSIWMKYEYPALQKNGVTVMKLKPGGTPVPYNSGSPPPSRSPSPQPPSRSSSQSSSKSASSKKGSRRRSVYPRVELYMRALEAGLFERAVESGVLARTGFAFGE